MKHTQSRGRTAGDFNRQKQSAPQPPEVIRVENGKKLPPKIRGVRLYPFLAMKPGQSFLVPERLALSTAYNLAFKGNWCAKQHGLEARFTVRRDDEGKLRCWRL